jgi:RimJ/RimL family protein N-acetyltransferase
MNYNCLNQQSFSHHSYQLIPIRLQDMQEIKNWRNEQMRVLRQKEPLTDEMQKQYYQFILLPAFSLNQPDQILFSFLIEERCIGYGGLVHIDWISQRAEISFLLATERSKDSVQYRQDFAIFLHLIKMAAFQTLQFHRIYTETFDIRPVHLSVLEQNGFIFEGRMREHVWIENQFVDSLIHGCLHGKLEK